MSQGSVLKLGIFVKMNNESRLTLRYLHGVSPARLRNIHNGYAA